MKNNPLFFDSTRFRGDNVIVNIELKGVELSHGEELFLLISRHDGTETVTKMNAQGLRKWHCQARMEYQQKVELEFLIKNAGEIVESRAPKVCVASYTIIETWERLPRTQVVAEAPAIVVTVPAAIEVAEEPLPKKLLSESIDDALKALDDFESIDALEAAESSDATEILDYRSRLPMILDRH